MQLLGEVYLRMGGNDGLAEAECDAVINSGDFSLMTSRYGIKAGEPGDAFSDMFIYGNERRGQSTARGRSVTARRGEGQLTMLDAFRRKEENKGERGSGTPKGKPAQESSAGNQTS